MVRHVAADESGAMDTPSPGPTGTGTGEQPTPPPAGPRVDRDQMKDLGRLRRSVTDRHIGGVAGGLARHLDVDPIIVRVTLVVAAFFGGAGLLAYIGLWVLVPEEGTDDQPLGLDQRSRSLALGGVGVLALLVAVGDWAGAYWFPWPLAIVAVIVVWFLHRKDKTSGHSPRQGHGYGYDDDHDQPARTGDLATSETSSARETYARAPRLPRNPRRRGPILFFFTLALVALAEGVLGVIDLAGASVASSAYPALALGLIALMLLVGSVWGRAGGLIALGIVAALATAATTLGNAFPDDRFDYAPTSAAQVKDTYDFGGGELTLDLSDVSDVATLDGRNVAIDGVGGRVEVIVPDGMDVSVETQIAAGDSRVFDRQQDGFDVNVDHVLDGGDDVPAMTIFIDLVVGEILVREAA